MNDTIMKRIIYLIILLINIFTFAKLNDIYLKYIFKFGFKENKIYMDIRNLDYYNKLNYIQNLKKVVYTIIFGNYDKVKPFNKQKGYDFYLFTDDISNKKYKKTNWSLLPIPDEIKKLNISIVKKQRYVKLHPHLYFKDYNLSIYIDATFTIKNDLNEFLLRILSPKYYLYIFEHPFRNKIYDEIKEVVFLKKEKKSMAEQLRKRYYIKEKFPDNNGLIESCLLIRRHNEEDCINFMNNWFKEIEKYSHRDQLSFNYIKWKKGIKLKYIPKNYALQYFDQKLSHLILKTYK